MEFENEFEANCNNVLNFENPSSVFDHDQDINILDDISMEELDKLLPSAMDCQLNLQVYDSTINEKDCSSVDNSLVTSESSINKIDNDSLSQLNILDFIDLFPSQSKWKRRREIPPNRQCIIPDCKKSAQSGRKCIAHGGGKFCEYQDCTTKAQAFGLCKKHGGGKRCQYENCLKSVFCKGYCRAHGRQMS